MTTNNNSYNSELSNDTSLFQKKSLVSKVSVLKISKEGRTLLYAKKAELIAKLLTKAELFFRFSNPHTNQIPFPQISNHSGPLFKQYFSIRTTIYYTFTLLSCT